MSDHRDPKQAVLDMLTAERYGPSLWWKTPAKRAIDSLTPEERATLDLAHSEPDREVG